MELSYLGSSYWTWGILTVLIILTQLLGVGEKVWIKVREQGFVKLGGLLQRFPLDLGRGVR